jgi:hypothetical protein
LTSVSPRKRTSLSIVLMIAWCQKRSSLDRPIGTDRLGISARISSPLGGFQRALSRPRGATKTENIVNYIVECRHMFER